MKPTKLTKDELIGALYQIIEVVRHNDSYEGSIEYSCLDNQCSRHEFMVQASFRTGNSMGQGSCCLIGTHDPDPALEPDKPSASTDAASDPGLHP